MFDKEIVLAMLVQVREWLEKIQKRSAGVQSPDDFIRDEYGQQVFDGICMLFIAIGENLKRIDKITGGTLFTEHPEADWTGAMGFRDVIVHQYFHIDHEEVFSIVREDLKPLLKAIETLIENLSS